MADKTKTPKVPAGLKRTLITPEGVDLGVELAPLTARFGALVLDMTLLLVGLFVFQLLINLVFWATSEKQPPELVTIIWFLVSFIARNSWFIFWEMRPAAATPGKRIMKIRVAMRNGGSLTADAVFARNVTRELEMFLPLSALAGGAAAASGSLGGWMALAMVVWTFVFSLIPLFNRDKLRAGDLIAGTWVVMAPRETLQPDLARDAGHGGLVFTQAQIDAYGVMERQVLEDVLRRMDRQVVKDVAARIREKIGWITGADETDAVFLKAYYAALRERLEKRLLFGHRRKDKHDISGLK